MPTARRRSSGSNTNACGWPIMPLWPALFFLFRPLVGSLSAVLFFFYPQPFHLGVERTGGDAQFFGGAARPRDAPAALPDNRHDMQSLVLIDGQQFRGYLRPGGPF